MKTLTHYEKIWLICVAVLFCVLCFYLGKAVYVWTNQSIIRQEIPKGRYENAPVIKYAKPSDYYKDRTYCKNVGEPRILVAVYKGQKIYRVEQCDFYFFVTSQNYKNLWKIVFDPTHDKAKAMKEYTKLKREYELQKKSAEISKLKWKVVK